MQKKRGGITLSINEYRLKSNLTIEILYMPIVNKPSTNNESNFISGLNYTRPKFDISEIILPKKTMDSLKDFISLFQVYDTIFSSWGLNSTHKHNKLFSVNLYGDSGTGKTMAAHIIASELNLPLISVNYAELESKYVGETSKNLTKLFSIAKEKNAILFFDEADAVLSRRVTNMSSSTDVSVNQTRSVLLSLMNDHEGIIIFTTNFIENFDIAFMRRILSHIKFELPNIDARTLLWEKYLPESMPVDNLSIYHLAEISEGLTGSDISNCVLKAAITAARNNHSVVSEGFFSTAIKDVQTSKKAHKQEKTEVKNNIVSEEYVESKIGLQAMTELKV